MNLRLKISPEELVALNVLLKKYLSDNPNNTLVQKYIGNIQKNIDQKRKDYKNILNEGFAELEHEITKIFFSRNDLVVLKEESTKDAQCSIDIKTDACAKCHFYNSGCQKEKVLRNYWGFDDKEFLSYFNAHQKGNADKCLMFEHRVIYTLLSFEDPLFSVEIEENGERVRQQFSTLELRLIIHKYGRDSFNNINDFEQLI